MLEQLTSETFTPLLNQTFDIWLEDGVSMAVELVQVTMLGDAASQGRAPFSLLFRASQRDQYLPQSIYRVEHPQLGEVSIFLVPVGPDGQGMRYEAVFN